MLLVFGAFQRITDSRFFAIKFVTADRKPLIFSRAGNLCFAQWRQFCRKFCPCGCMAGRNLGVLGRCQLQNAHGFCRFGQRLFCRMPTRQEQLRLGLANTVCHRPVARCLPCLLLQRIALFDQAGNNIIQPFKVGFCAFQPQLGLMPSGVQTADICCLFKKGAAVCRTRPHNRADAALRYNTGRARAGRAVGKQQLHILGPRRTHIHKIAASLAAFDLAGDFNIVVIIEFTGRRPVAVVQLQRDFCQIAGGARVGAGKDYIIHFAATHLARVAFAHHPAQAFDNVGFATAVRTDDACQPGFDINLCVFRKGFETGNFQ